MSSSSRPFVVHTTPPFARLPASDVESIYLAAVFQLAAPGRFALQTANWGENGSSLPFVTHLGQRIRRQQLSSVSGYRDLDEELDAVQKAEVISWTAYIEQNITDLVNHTIYSLPPNYPHFAQAQSSSLSFPQSHYIPQRIRAIHKARLDHVGLWGLGGLNIGDAADEDRKKLDETFVAGPGGTMAPRAWTGWRSGREFAERKKQWGEEELKTRVRGVLDPIARRWKDGYLFGSNPSTADLKLYAHLAMLLTPLPNPLLADLIRSTYPVLVQLHDRLEALIPEPKRIDPSPTKSRSWWDTFSFSTTSPSPSPSTSSSSANGKPKGKTPSEKRFEMGRWAWFATAGVGMITYLFASGIISIDFEGSADETDGEWQDASELEVEGEEEESGEIIVEVA